MTTATLALAAIDEWFQDEIKLLVQMHHRSNVDKEDNMVQLTSGYALACKTREEMRMIVEGMADSK